MSAESLLAIMGGLGALIAGVITPVVTAIILYQNARHRRSKETDADSLLHLRAAADLQQRQIERLDAHVGEMQSAIDQLADEHSNCRVEIEALYGEYVRLHDYARRVTETLRKLGGDPGDLPPLAERPDRPDRDEAIEHRRRTLAQNTENLSKLSGAVPPPPPLPPHRPGNLP